MTVHSALPDRLVLAADSVLAEAGVQHVAHGDAEPMGAAEAAASDETAIALLGPHRSADVAEAVEATAPAGLPLIAPAATWAGVTRDDEPGCDDPARHRGTVLRMVARDTEVAARIAADLRLANQIALVVAGEHDYGRQLAGQLGMAELPSTERPEDADLVVLCGLVGEPEITRAAHLAPLPLIAFDGVQGAALGNDRPVRLALPYAPVAGMAPQDLIIGVDGARRGAALVVEALRHGATDRPSLLTSLRALGPFDAHGDPIDPPVWLWQAAPDWSLHPDRAL